MTAMTYPAHLQPTKTIGRFHALLIQLFGPSDSWDNPLMGTKHDPRLAEHRQRVAVARRRARAAARAVQARPVPRDDYDAFAPALAS